MTHVHPLAWPEYTFLAAVIFLVSLAGVKLVRSSILRRRHRRMVEEGTQADGSPTPFDPSKKPELWEAYLGGGGWQLVGSIGNGNGEKELDIGTNWNLENSRNWESIKPVYAGYAGPLTSAVSTPNLTTSLSPPVSIPAHTLIHPSARRGDEEENREENRRTVPSFLTRVMNPSSTVLSSSSANDETNSESRSFPANISMTELSFKSPSTIRVAVLIAMPSHSSHGSLSNKAQSHPLEFPPSPTTLRIADNEEKPLPLAHLEMGVADVVVVVGRSGNSLTDSVTVHHDTRREEKTNHSRGSSYDEP